jgi:galactose mutarotase-like enzyme
VIESPSATESTLRNLRVVQLENNLLHITILPEVGGRIWQITYKPLSADLLWNNSAQAPRRQPLHACYDDNWTGGWDELFPNDEAGEIGRTLYPDHGELWTGEWTSAVRDGGTEALLRFTTPISGFEVEKRIRLKSSSAVVEVDYRLRNASGRALPFLFKLHPAFAVHQEHRIDFPAMEVRLEPDFTGTLEGAPQAFPWPLAEQAGRVRDLRQVPAASERAVHFFYGTKLEAGWCGITNSRNGVAAALRFDPEVFTSCWLFASHGGWNDHHVAVLEPATGYPFRMSSMIEAGRARALAPGESLETTVLFSVSAGLKSIGGVDADGTIVPGDEL